MTYEEFRKELHAIPAERDEDGNEIYRPYVSLNDSTVNLDGVFTASQLRLIADFVDKYYEGQKS